jgi:hypothetical protein
VTIGDRADEVSTQRYCHLAVLRPCTVVRAFGDRKTRSLVSLHGRVSHDISGRRHGAALVGSLGATGGCRAGMISAPFPWLSLRDPRLAVGPRLAPSIPVFRSVPD